MEPAGHNISVRDTFDPTGDCTVDSIIILRQLVPEIFTMIENRYVILRAISFYAPIGRRALAVDLDRPERAVRRELDKMQELGLLISSHSGMCLTKAGEKILVDLEKYIREIRGLADLEQDLQRKLKLKKVIIVPGDTDYDPAVKKDLATATARYLRSILTDGDILAVTGGTTLAQVADSFDSDGLVRDIIVVPARGGLGEDVDLQANTIAAKLAQGLGGIYRLLHAPDNVKSHLMATILKEPRIREVVSLGRRAQVLLHGIGTAEEMAKRRGLDDERLMQLIADGAVGEAFGYYFSHEGKIVYSTSSVGIRLDDLAKIPIVIAVGGGRSKAWAVLSVLHQGYCDVCITDEGVARRLITILKNKGED